MSEETTATETPAAPKKPAPPQNPQGYRQKFSRKTRKKAGREKRKAKIRADKEYATTYFSARAKRSDDKKVAFRKRRSKK